MKVPNQNFSGTRHLYSTPLLAYCTFLFPWFGRDHALQETTQSYGFYPWSLTVFLSCLQEKLTRKSRGLLLVAVTTFLESLLVLDSAEFVFKNWPNCG